MKGKTLFICLVLVSVLIVGVTVAVISTDMFKKDGNTKEEEQETNVSWVIASEDELLGKYEKSDKHFERIEIGDTIVYWHQRMIDYAKVEGDFINYQFDKDTKEFKKKIIHWRDDLPEHATPVITKEEAESIAGGGSATLYFISPDSPIFKIKPTPKDPCWVVRSGDTITIIDAMNGKILGYGIPPP